MRSKFEADPAFKGVEHIYKAIVYPEWMRNLRNDNIRPCDTQCHFFGANVRTNGAILCVDYQFHPGFTFPDILSALPDKEILRHFVVGKSQYGNRAPNLQGYAQLEYQLYKPIHVRVDDGILAPPGFIMVVTAGIDAAQIQKGDFSTVFDRRVVFESSQNVATVLEMGFGPNTGGYISDRYEISIR